MFEMRNPKSNMIQFADLSGRGDSNRSEMSLHKSWDGDETVQAAFGKIGDNRLGEIAFQVHLETMQA